MGHYTLPSPQPSIVAQEATTAPHLDLTATPCQPPIYVRLGPNQDACSVSRSPSPDSLEPWTFVQHPQQAPFLPCFNGAATKVRPSARLKTRAPPRRGERRTERIAADRLTSCRSPWLITWARSPNKTLRATSTISWRARAPTTTTP